MPTFGPVIICFDLNLFFSFLIKNNVYGLLSFQDSPQESMTPGHLFLSILFGELFPSYPGEKRFFWRLQLTVDENFHPLHLRWFPFPFLSSVLHSLSSPIEDLSFSFIGFYRRCPPQTFRCGFFSFNRPL